jgi:aminoglycoside N3'-acetyltransferase
MNRSPSSTRGGGINLVADFRSLGISVGDTVLIRGALSSIGKVNRNEFLTALLNSVGPNGTIVSLAFTDSTFLWKTRSLEPYTLSTRSYAGAIPNTMLAHPNSNRSLHPQCSYVAIGRHAAEIVADHGPHSRAYEPIRKLINLDAKMALIGCVSSSPGFTTTHLAEADLGHHRRAVFPQLMAASPYIDEHNQVRIYQRRDMGMCSNSYWKFYSHYVREGLLKSANIGAAYSILVPAKESYELEKRILHNDPKFNICGEPDCSSCNMLRWDRIHHAPGLIARKILKRLSQK